jgi:hypothetical protein
MVVKDQLAAAIVLPAASVAPLAVAVYVVENAKAAEGVKVAVLVAALYATVAVTAVPAAFLSTKDSVEGWTASLNVAVTAVPVDTLVAPAAGERAVTVGAVRSGGAAVVKDQVVGAMVLPAASLAPLAVAV